MPTIVQALGLQSSSRARAFAEALGAAGAGGSDRTTPQ